MIEIIDIKYSKLIELGFVRQEIDDRVLFNETGYHGFNLFIEFKYLKLGISSPCKAGELNWRFQLYNSSNGDTIRELKLIELEPLIELLKIRNEEIANVIDSLDKELIAVENDLDYIARAC